MSQSHPSDDPDLAELVRLALRKLRTELCTAEPGIVVKPSKPGEAGELVVEVQPTRLVIPKGPDGQERKVPPTLAPRVPAAVCGQLDWGAFKLTAPIRVGTQGWLIYSHRSIDVWRGSAGVPMDPGFGHTHQAQDALFIPMGRAGPLGMRTHATDLVISTQVDPSGAAEEPGEISMTPAGAITVKSATTVTVDAPSVSVKGEAAIDLDAPLVKVGGEEAVQAIAIAEMVIAAIDTFLGAGVPIATDGGANLKTTMIAAWNMAKNSIKATKGKVL